MTASIDPFVNFKDRFGRAESLIPVECNWIDNLILSANTAVNYTIPANATVLLFAYSGANDVFVKLAANATVPAANVTDGTGQDVNPTGIFVSNTTTLSFISAGAAKIAIRVYGG